MLQPERLKRYSRNAGPENVRSLITMTFGAQAFSTFGQVFLALFGAVNGIITVRFRVPSLITTVGTLFFLQGIVVSIYNSQPIVTPVQEPFNEIFGESLYDPRGDSLWSWHSLTAFTPLLWTALVVAAMALVLNRTTFGLHTIATGSNIVGAREIGIRTEAGSGPALTTS